MQVNIDWLAEKLRIQALNKEQRGILATAFESEFVLKDMPIIHQGTSVRSLYVLHSGSLRIVHKNNFHLATLNKNSHSRTFGEMSFFGDEPASADVYAEQPCEVYKITCEKFQWLMQNHADIAMKLMAFVLRNMGVIIRSMDNSKH